MEENFLDDSFDEIKGESPRSMEPKCLWTLVVDTSSSMSGRMSELNESLVSLQQAVENDPIASERMELSIVEFNSQVKVRTAPKLIYDVTIPKLTASGVTHMVEGLERALQVVQTRMQWYWDTRQPYFRPFVVLITDGAPNGPGNIDDMSKKLSSLINHENDKKKIFFLAFGVSGADFSVLEKLSDSQMPPVDLKDADFQKFFQWMANSVKSVSSSSPSDTDAHMMIAQSALDEFQDEC